MKANETFAFVGNVTHYARVWLNISAQLRTYLEEGKLHHHLAWMQQVTHSFYLSSYTVRGTIHLTS